MARGWRASSVIKPVKVRVSRHELAIPSVPGPYRSIRLAGLEAGRSVSYRYRNRRIGEFLKKLDLTGGRSTGVPKIPKAMAANGSLAARFETDADRLAHVIRRPSHPCIQARDEPEIKSTGEVERLLFMIDGEMTRQQIQDLLALKHEDSFRCAYLLPALASGLIEMTQPDKPRRSKQRYRLTAAGKRWRAQSLK